MARSGGPWRGFLAGIATCAILVIAVAGGVVSIEGIASYAKADASPPAVSHPVTTVTAGPLRKTIAGEVDVTPTTVVAVAAPVDLSEGTYTRAGTKAGDQVDDGATVATINERPIVVIQSEVPFFRTLAVESVGRDVAALQAALERFGYELDGDELGDFGTGTARAAYAFFSDRGYQALDISGQPITHWNRSATVVLQGEILAAPILPLLAVQSCGAVGERSSSAVCTLRSSAGAAVVKIPSSTSGEVREGQAVEVTLADGQTFNATVGAKLNPQARTSDEASGDSTGSPDALTYQLNTPEPVSGAASGTARVVLASAPESSLQVMEIAIRSGDDGNWLETPDAARLPVEVGLCASGVCVVSGDNVAEGTEVRLPDVYNG